LTAIGKLIEVSPRVAWQHEARDFTPWLLDNLEQLGEAIGITLEPEGMEVAVGPFSADIVARDALGRLVLIENQLDVTDHSHLGQILTYLSGLEADLVIWLATEFRESHLSVINWLNDNTTEQFAFFAIRLRVVRIGDSPPAPVFDVVARPNQWERSMHRAIRERAGDTSDLASRRREFWQHYLTRHPEDEDFGIQVTGSPSNWLAPRKAIELYVSVFLAKKGVGVFLRGPRGTTPAEVQARLAPHAARFEELVGGCQQLGSKNNHPVDELKIDTENRENWDRASDWLHERGHRFLDAAMEIFGRNSEDTESGENA